MGRGARGLGQVPNEAVARAARERIEQERETQSDREALTTHPRSP